MGFGSQKWTGGPEVGGGARSGAGEPGLIEEPEVNREVDTATDQQSHPRARSFDHQLSFGIIPDGIPEHFTFIRVRQEHTSAMV